VFSDTPGFLPLHPAATIRTGVDEAHAPCRSGNDLDAEQRIGNVEEQCSIVIDPVCKALTAERAGSVADKPSFRHDVRDGAIATGRADSPLGAGWASTLHVGE
jgi:hypothetical protein